MDSPELRSRDWMCCVLSMHAYIIYYMRIISLGGDDLHTHRSTAGGRAHAAKEKKFSQNAQNNVRHKDSAMEKHQRSYPLLLCVAKASLILIHLGLMYYNTRSKKSSFHMRCRHTDVTVQRARKKTPTRPGVMLFTHSP